MPFQRTGNMKIHDWHLFIGTYPSNLALRYISIYLYMLLSMSLILINTYTLIYRCTGTDVGKFCLFGLLDVNQYTVLADLSDIFKIMLSLKVNVSEFQAFENTMHRYLSNFERSMPETSHAMVFHLIIPLYRCILRHGPSSLYWMYIFGKSIIYIHIICLIRSHYILRSTKHITIHTYVYLLEIYMSLYV